ncbi:MAG: tetratricopeptide repeat protein [Phycisphaerales bacterium]|nr:tetratricopeptide repeat protein [Phycisphaerales bacterium]
MNAIGQSVGGGDAAVLSATQTSGLLPASALSPAPFGAAPALPEMIGRYRIKQLIGAGGMGSVYLALQEQPRRTVALKVVRAGAASPTVLRRFEYESQVLARMRHPGIAQIYEAGTHDDGTGAGPVPFFAMEYIPEAATLIDFARRRTLSVGEKLELFIKVCEAVQYGHTKGIIHRDLKPANILVDGTGEPKVIDYGVARGTDSDMAGATLQTAIGQFVGTPQYMSPEQCRGDPQGVDVRSDVYSLGVVMYELMCGVPPYEIGTDGCGLYEAARVVCEAAPKPAGAVDRRLRGDIETILAKALEKEKGHRFQSVADLAADLRRHLRDEPIMARSVGPIGRLAKWVRRNREIAVVGSAAAAVLAVVSTVLLYQLVMAEHQASQNLKLAEQNLRAARQNFHLVRDMLEFKDGDGQSRVRSGMVEVEPLLDDAASNLERQRPELPSTEADFREILGVSYTGLRSLSKARQQLERVLDIRTRLLVDPSSGLADALHNLAVAQYWDGEYGTAYDLYARSLAMRQRLNPGDHRDTAFSLTHLAACAMRLGRLDESQNLYEQALSMRRRMHGAQHQEIAASLNNLAKLFAEREDQSRAEAYFRQSLDMIRGLVGESDLSVSHAAANLAYCLLETGQYAEARALFERALIIRRGRLADDHLLVADARLGLACTSLGLGDARAAEDTARPVLAALRVRMRENHPDIARAAELVGDALLAQDRFAEAEEPLRQAVATTKAAAAPPPLDLAERQSKLGDCLMRLGRNEEAEPLLISSFRVLREQAVPQSNRLAEAAQRLIKLYERTGNTAELAALAAAFPSANRVAAPLPEETVGAGGPDR